jgi:glycopeptide antibiotics resistance protein
MRGFNVLPWLLPGLTVSVLVGFVVSRRVGRFFGTVSSVGFGLVVAFGLVVSATLTPLRSGLELDTVGIGTCDLSRLGIAPLQQMLRISDPSLNVLLFIPLGIAVGFVPGSRRKSILAGLAILCPVAIESAQLLLPILGRGCQSGDVFDNLTGLLLGWLIGTGARVSYKGLAPPGEPR